MEKPITYVNKLLNDSNHHQLILTIIVIILGIIFSIIASKLVYVTVNIFTRNNEKIKTNLLLKSYCNIIATIVKILFYILAFLLILVIYHVQITVIITSAGFIGILITYIFQDPIKDITNGFYIVFSAPFEVGDTVKIGSFVGKVKEMKSRYIIIHDVSGNKCIINNRTIDNVIVLNRKIEFKRRKK